MEPPYKEALLPKKGRRPPQTDRGSTSAKRGYSSSNRFGKKPGPYGATKKKKRP